MWIRDGEVLPGVFQNRPATSDGGMSCDWEKYSSPEQTKQRARTPEDNAVLRFGAGVVASLPNQRLEHDPLDDNRAHSQVFGEKTTEIRLKLKRLCVWAIPLQS